MWSCMHKCIKIVPSGLCILVKNHYLCFRNVPTDSTSVKFEALTTYRDGDINQNRVKISIVMLVLYKL